ncbi:2725_t:CDS:2 [Dentiscutata erythropus]|uniref:2725_t:CDS:1 n=1 Tax=Dentiscutata erythropus TaxID=1348616 RepID=A0A9N9ICJ6_9GLOM|nr:2725_t:CDS:2 [Dentiscutata erythropus]
MSLQRLRYRPRRPFWQLPQHRLPVLSLYKTLLRLSKTFPNDIHKKYLYFAIREKFRSRRYETSVMSTIKHLKEAQECRLTLQKALQGDKESFKHIDDLAWGRKGRLKKVLEVQKIHKLVYDTRTVQSRMIDPHRAYRVPLDPRLYKPPRVRFFRRKRWLKKKHKWREGLVKYTIVTQLGYRLQRIRGWRQPTWISMMMNKRIRQHQKRIDRFRELESYLEMVKGEEVMLKTLNPKLNREMEGFDKLIIQEMIDSRKFYENMMKREKKAKLDDNI